MERVKKPIMTGLRFILCVAVLFMGAQYIKSSKIVALEDGNKILYNNTVYEEVFETFDFQRGKCLGTVKFTDAKHRIYSISAGSEYLFVDLDWDWRIYKISQEDG